ncbi:MAG: hypothetical protein FD169_371 [Bacillota bacterium]|nr:MAG: hypothetical protein FD169_371 [Bacillota bacterium]
MKIFVRASSLVIKGTTSSIMRQLREMAKTYPHMTLLEYIKHRLN